jgi:hypothetical protein
MEGTSEEAAERIKEFFEIWLLDIILWWT